MNVRDVEQQHSFEWLGCFSVHWRHRDLPHNGYVGGIIAEIDLTDRKMPVVTGR